MRINIDRMCKLAGVEAPAQPKKINEARSRRRRVLREQEEPPEIQVEKEDISDSDETMEEMEEMIEIDEKMLVQELRRAKRIMKENKKIETARLQELQESQLKAVIDQEVKNVLKELNLNSSWIYGNKKPTRSKKGYTHQGTFLKGIGFK